jgi:multiple sugar transport system ATP-binding protein
VAIEDVSFDVHDGEFFTIIGPTNAGKTTTLRTIAGLEKPDAGAVFINDRTVNTLHPSRRKVSLMFQNLALFPHLSGFENIAFPLRAAGASLDEIRARVGEIAELLRITHLLNRLPRTYSGGEQQRVALGRALAPQSEVLLLDEPLSNLDAHIRISLRAELKRLHRELGRTIVYVTHDHVEAMSLSDRIAVLRGGRIQQIGTPHDVYERPVNRFVATFIGSPPMNFVPATITGDAGGLWLRNRWLRIAPPPHLAAALAERVGRSVLIAVRPEDITVTSLGQGRATSDVTVYTVEPLGAKTIVEVKTPEGNIKAIVGSAWRGSVNMPVAVRVEGNRIRVLMEGEDVFLPPDAGEAAPVGTTSDG